MPLEVYNADKFVSRKENLKDNSKCTALLSKARASYLRMKGFVQKYTQNDGACRVFKKKRETI